MTLFVPGVGNVPIRWMPASDEDYKDKSEGARSGYQPIAIVHHRGVLNTLGALDSTFAHGDSDPATVGSPGRPVSANFGIGSVPGGYAISQYVDLSDTAYCNGDCQANPKAYPNEPSNWDKWYGHYGHNERTVSIEHDDNGGYAAGSGKGIVVEEILLISMALDKLMLSGDIDAMRAAGIHIRDQATADALGKIVPSSKTLIRHYDIAGKLKPSCWRPWEDDKVGFPQARYIAYMTLPAPTPDPAPTPTAEEDMPPITDNSILGFNAVVKTNMNVRSAPSLKASVLRVTSAPEPWTAIGWVKGDVDPDDGSDLWLMRLNAGKYEFTTHANLASQPADPTPFNKADVSAAVNTATAPLNAKIAAAKSALG